MKGRAGANGATGEQAAADGATSRRAAAGGATGGRATIHDVLFELEEAGLLSYVMAKEGGTDEDAALAGCSCDSREVRPGQLFFCKGERFEPRFLRSALDAGAVCYVAEEGLAPQLEGVCAGQRAYGIYVSDVRGAMAVASPVVYGHPDRELFTIGVTGTKGKTTTAYLLKSIFEAAGEAPGVIGSIEADDGVERAESKNTTPEAPELWRHLANCRDSGRKAMVMEVSSQGLKYGRVDGLHLDVACFLNLGRDHISPAEHPDFDDYVASKLRIFGLCDTAVVSLNTAEVDRVLSCAEAARRLVLCAVEPAAIGECEASERCERRGASPADLADAYASRVRPGEEAVAFGLHLSPALAESGEPEEHEVVLGMPGLFNVENAVAAVACARLAGLPMDAIAHGLARAHVPGRMELLRSADGRVTAIVDYAHNELSFRALFASVARQYPGHTVVAVFGAPGDKALERRRDLPREAATSCDLVIYTEEDPGSEDVRDICAELAANTPAGTAYEIIPDRAAAAHRAFEAARAAAPAVVLLLAKGDERTQHRGTRFEQVESDLSLARRTIDPAPPA